MTTGPGGTSRAVTDAERDVGVKAIGQMVRELARWCRIPLGDQ